MYLEVLRNRNNILDRYQYVSNRQGVKVIRIPIYTCDSGTFSCSIVTPLHQSNHLYLHNSLITIKFGESIRFYILKISM